MRLKERPMESNKSFSLVQVAAIFCIGMVVSACSSTYPKQASSFAVPPQSQLIPSDIADYLTHSAPDSTTSLAQSPWGDNITLFAKAPYFSASGAECRQLIVESRLDKRTELACTQDRVSWYKARALLNR